MRIEIAPGAGALLPPPLTEADLRYPTGLDVQLSGLGIETCSTSTLELSGPESCPVDSFMGDGSAIAEFPLDHRVFHEAARIAIVRTPEQAGHLAMLFYVYDETAVSAQIVLKSRLLPAATPFGGLLAIEVPLVQSLPEAPDVSVGEIKLVLGPKDLTYYERVHGKVIRYKPGGVGLSKHCPRGGFPFSVELRFLGGSRASARTAVPCPKG